MASTPVKLSRSTILEVDRLSAYVSPWMFKFLKNDFKETISNEVSTVEYIFLPFIAWRLHTLFLIFYIWQRSEIPNRPILVRKIDIFPFLVEQGFFSLLLDSLLYNSNGRTTCLDFSRKNTFIISVNFVAYLKIRVFISREFYRGVKTIL